MTLYEKALGLKLVKKRAARVVNGLEKKTFLCLVNGGFTNCEEVYNNWGKRRNLYSRDHKIWQNAKINKNKLLAAIQNGSIWEVAGLGIDRVKEVCEWLESDER